MALTVWYRKPRTIHREVVLLETDYISRKETLIVEDKLKDRNMVIPVTCYVNPAGVLQIIALNHRAAHVVASLLIVGLKEKKQKNIVEVSVQELAEKSSMSRPTILTGIAKLVEAEFIVKRGKQRYYISPILAWYGNQVDWAVELSKLKERVT